MKKGTVAIIAFELIILMISGCGGSGATNTLNNNGGSLENNSTNNTQEESNTSSWHVASTLYDHDIKKSFSIEGNKCRIWENKDGIAYQCDDNLSSTAQFNYDKLAKVVTPYLYHNNLPSMDKEILIAESNVSKNDFNFYYPPIIYKGKMYGNFGGRYEIDNNGTTSYVNRYEVNEYNLSKFTQDMALESLISKKIFSANREISPIFSPSVSSIMELNGYLYFNAFPIKGGFYNDDQVNLDYENHKYDIRNQKSVYTKASHPIYIYKKNPSDSIKCNRTEYTNVVSITQGWMVPGSGTKIAFLDGEKMTEIDACSGIDSKVTEGDEVLSGGGPHYYCTYSVMVDQRENEMTSPFALSVSNDFNYFSVNEDELSSTAFERQNKTRFGHSNVDRSVNVFNDFTTKYGNSKSYTHLQLQNELLLDGDALYLLGVMSYGSDDDTYNTLNAYNDLYLFKYNTNLQLQDATLLVSDTKKLLDLPVAKWFYKYKDNLYFKYDNGHSREFYSYNLENKKVNYTYHIGSMYKNGVNWYDYAITGDTIILPQNINSSKKGYDYDLVFTVLDLKSGSVIKTIRSDKLQIEDSTDTSLKSMGSYVYGGAVYFVFEKNYVGYGDHYTRNILIKIDSPNNKTKVSRFKGDNHITGVIRNTYVESALEPKNIKERLILDLYRYIHSGNESDFADLNSTLVNYIANEKSVTMQELFQIQQTKANYTEYNATTTDVNLTKIETYDQSAPLYNTELLGNTQTFYIPLLKEVSYSSTGEDSVSDLGEARLHINAQYGCTKSYFRFPYKGSYKLFGFDPIDSDREFGDPAPESLSFKTDVPMLVVDYQKLFDNQTFLRYGIDAVEYDNLDTVEMITATLKESLDSLVSTAASIAIGNYASAICSTANIITTYAINSLNAGDTYYGSAMKIYTAKSNFGIENNRTFTYDTIEGSAKSFKIDANSAGDLVENICAGVSLNPATVISFATKADYDEKHVKAKVLPTWHRGIEITHLKVQMSDLQLFQTPIQPLSQFHLAHTFKIRGRIATLGTQKTGYEAKTIKEELQPFLQQSKIIEDLVADSTKEFKGWNTKNYNHIKFEANYLKGSTNGDKQDSVAGVYLEMTMYSDDMQVGIFTDTLFLDEAIFTDSFTKDGKKYSKTVTKPFYFPDEKPSMKRPKMGTISYKVSFEVE